MEETISLKEIAQILKKRMALILVITMLAIAASAVVTYFFITPKYDASTQILVNQSNDTNSLYTTNAVQTNVQLVNTYSVIIDNPSVLNPVIQALDLKMNASQLKSMLTVATEQNSQVFTLTAETANAAESARIVNAVAASFKNRVQKAMNVDNVTILSPANVSAASAPVKPKPLMNLAIAAVVGLMASVGLAFLLDYLDNTIKTEEDVAQLLELPVLGVVTEITSRDDKRNKANARHSESSHRVGGRHDVSAKL
ncbi:YveK family protein [Sporolactobacillus spathodeae]|uniref:Capsular polysaccharide biosynthesis protein n=1 Tax=Sporolactobacillus spathodeae TaxID=1465502 RepID=A0ABS2Q7P0_9BACL|nr:Wzz/FepE/Etk N-terminal domain-containing protein [Sporolactobacillus spathodeae]MBM7657763.1 capsular polysaccharide biosynthesis protein [Sporolactobacillus spathodeae]